jgi:RimJ/RimL family protein N-acetyltransferase
MKVRNFSFAKLYHAATEPLQGLVAYRCFEFYKLDLQTLAANQQYTIREFRTYSNDITNIHRELGREKYYSRKNAISRFKHGLYFYTLVDDNKVVATSWIHPQGERFVDEIGYMIRTPLNSLWLRDIYVSPDYRGRHICATFIKNAARQFFPSATSFYSDIESHNKPSIRAHLRCGYQHMCNIKALHICKTLMVRSHLQPGCEDFQLSGYKADRKLCLTLSDYYQYRAHNLA